ncbi:MAG: hypothetical protein EA376_01265 [Phycisphaeraceae bacterium]|nr:MAG: hypothetical protein EA376_01265 [Phycisphaeraceae bacterium]
MNAAIPPSATPGKVALEMRFVRPGDREDAAQEAWLAHLEGRDAARAVSAFRHRERRHRLRETAAGELMSVVVAAIGGVGVGEVKHA